MALIELGAADYAIRNAGANENFFKGTGLSVGSVEHRNVSVVCAIAVLLVDFVGDELSLIVCRVAGVANQLVASAAVGEQVFVWTVEVVRNNRVGGVENVLGRAVVLLEQNRLGTDKVFFELDDVANVGTAKRIDRLVAVANHGETCRRQHFAGASIHVAEFGRHGLGQFANKGILRVVGVLVFVDQNVAKLALVLSGNLREIAEQKDRLRDEVVEVEGVVALEFALVAAEDFGNHARGRVGGVGVAHKVIGVV